MGFLALNFGLTDAEEGQFWFGQRKLSRKLN